MLAHSGIDCPGASRPCVERKHDIGQVSIVFCPSCTLGRLTNETHSHNVLDARDGSCKSMQGCSECVAMSKCAFSKVTFECQDKKEGNKEQVQSNVGCPQMNQMQSVSGSCNQEYNTADSPTFCRCLPQRRERRQG